MPRPGEFGYDTWTPEGAKNRSGVNVWGYMTVDAKRGILYMPLGAPNNDLVGTDRPGNNLFSSSIVAVDANTGKYLWHFQVTHHDIWDMDTQSAPMLVDVKKDGKTIPAVMTVNKNALMFILDRINGKPIFGVEERAVPQSKCRAKRPRRPSLSRSSPSSSAWARSRTRQALQGRAGASGLLREIVADNQFMLGFDLHCRRAIEIGRWRRRAPRAA